MGTRRRNRKDLGDLDESEWEIGDDGRRRDPWQFQNLLIMVDREGGEIYTFTTASKGGANRDRRARQGLRQGNARAAR